MHGDWVTAIASIIAAVLGCLVPERPCDNVGGLNPLSIKSDCNAADFLD
jgi:hypothetical protein